MTHIFSFVLIPIAIIASVPCAFFAFRRIHRKGIGFAIGFAMVLIGGLIYAKGAFFGWRGMAGLVLISAGLTGVIYSLLGLWTVSKRFGVKVLLALCIIPFVLIFVFWCWAIVKMAIVTLFSVPNMMGYHNACSQEWVRGLEFRIGKFNEVKGRVPSTEELHAFLDDDKQQWRQRPDLQNYITRYTVLTNDAYAIRYNDHFAGIAVYMGSNYVRGKQVRIDSSNYNETIEENYRAFRSTLDRRSNRRRQELLN